MDVQVDGWVDGLWMDRWVDDGWTRDKHITSELEHEDSKEKK